MLDAFAWHIVRCVYPVLATVAVVGLCLNTILLLTTIKTKSLRSTANILIGSCALFDIIHQTGYLIQFPILFSDYYINSFTCSCMIFIPELGMAAGAFCVLTIGIDRMLSILILRNHLSFYYFLAIALFCCWSGYLMIAYWTDKQLICSMPSPYHGDAVGLWWDTLNIVNGISVIVYFVMWQTARRREVSQHSKRILVSIGIVMAFEVTCWLIYSILLNLSRFIVEDPDQRPPYHYFACLFVNIGIAIKAIVYYMISSEYRRAMRTLFGIQRSSSVISNTATTMQ